MIYAMTCADERYMPVAKFQLDTAIRKGKVDKTFFFRLNEMDKAFTARNERILNAGGERRKGCYLWKPYFIHKALSKIAYGDFLIYLDAAGSYYRSRVSEVTSFMERNNLDIVGSRNGRYTEKDWTKRDTFIMLGCDEEKYIFQKQCYAGFLTLRKTERSVKFIDTWLEHCQNYHMITDCPNISGLDNYEGFAEHRFDQSILSLLMTKENVLYIERLPIPLFCEYHHTMLMSVKEIRKSKRAVIFENIRKHDIGMVWYLWKMDAQDSLWFQRIVKRIVYGRERWHLDME